MNIPFLLFLFSLCSAGFVNSHMCHQCASKNAVWNWVKYGFPVNHGDSMSSDDNCLTESKLKKDGDKCSGMCSTINITLVDGDNAGSTIAMVRDCATKHVNIQENEIICESRIKFVNRRNVNITTCYCNGHYCNGVGAADAQQKNSITLPPKTTTQPTVESSFPWFIIHISCIVVLVILLGLTHIFNTCGWCCFRRKHDLLT